MDVPMNEHNAYLLFQRGKHFLKDGISRPTGNFLPPVEMCFQAFILAQGPDLVLNGNFFFYERDSFLNERLYIEYKPEDVDNFDMCAGGHTCNT